jgi:hypothetical protein
MLWMLETNVGQFHLFGQTVDFSCCGCYMEIALILMIILKQGV